MALNPADIAVVSALLDQALSLPADVREVWLAALPEEHHRHRDTLRDMLAKEAELDTDPRLDSLPTLAPDESLAHQGDLLAPTGQAPGGAEVAALGLGRGLGRAHSA